jgi:hypothetical protein
MGNRITIAWLFGYRRLTIRYEHHVPVLCLITLAAVLTSCEARKLDAAS